MEYTLYTEFPQPLERAWNALLAESVTHVPFLRYEYLHNWWQTRGGGEWTESARLAIVTAETDGELCGIAPLFIAPTPAGRPAGRPAILLLGSIEISDYLDLIVRPADLDAFVSGLLPFLEEKISGGLPLDLYNLLETSPTLNALQSVATAQGYTFKQERLLHSPYIPLPGDWETYLAGIDKKQRHEIRRKMRRLSEAAVPSRWYFVEDPVQLDPEIDAFLALMAQDEKKAAFLTPLMKETLRGMIRCAFEAGCLQLSFLEIDGKKASAYLSFDYLNRIWVYNSGLDRALMEYSPGWVLLGHLLQWANENGREAFDFMRGDEEYKYRFGAIDRFVVRATVER